MNYPRTIVAAALVCGFAGAAWAWPQSAPTLRGPGETQQKQQEPAPSPTAPAPPAGQPDPRAQIRTTVSLVVVPVTVKNGSGDLITGLEQHDFRIFEDGIEQEISEFSADAFPLSAAVLLDDDLKRSSADHVQQTLQAVAGGFSAGDAGITAPDEVALWRFDDVPESISDFIASPDALLDQLKKIELNSSVPGASSAPMTGGPRVNTDQPPGPIQTQGAVPVGRVNNKHINDAIYAAAEQLEDRPSERRKIIFLISDGQNAKNNTHSYADTLKLCLADNISVYSVAVGERYVNHDLSVLGRYAHATGGDIFYASSREDLEHFYARAFEQARNQYTIAYVPARTDRSKPYHAIEVRVEHAGLILLSRDGYYPNQTP